MKHIIAFAGSNSKHSINKELAEYTASKIKETKITVLDLNDFELPIYSIDLEKEIGIPKPAQIFLENIKKSDGIVLSLAEHNGAYSAVFKNLFDWMSRIEGKIFYGKPMLLMATSPGARGGASVLEIAKDRFPRHDAQIIETFSLPSFFDNFSQGEIVNSNLKTGLEKVIETFTASL